MYVFQMATLDRGGSEELNNFTTQVSPDSDRAACTAFKLHNAQRCGSIHKAWHFRSKFCYCMYQHSLAWSD